MEKNNLYINWYSKKLWAPTLVCIYSIFLLSKIIFTDDWAVPAFMKVLLPLSAAKEERLAKGKEKKEGASKWSQSTSDGICPLPERTQRTYAGPIPWLTFPRNHQETWSRVDTVSPEWQTGSYSGCPANSIIVCLVNFSQDIKSCCMILFLKDISHQLCFSVQYLFAGKYLY